jgi:hypothetical protein
MGQADNLRPQFSGNILLLLERGAHAELRTMKNAKCKMMNGGCSEFRILHF